MVNRSEMKWEAKSILGNAHVSPYVFSLVYLAIICCLVGANTATGGGIVSSMKSMAEYYTSILPEYADDFSAILQMEPLITVPTVVGIFISVMTWLLQVIFTGGWIFYHLGIRRGEDMPYGTVCEGFSLVGKLILLEIVIYIKVFLWSLIPLIGTFTGIIAQYRYSFSLYNLCENPDLGVMESINMSKVQTYGFKKKLFILDISFIGWYFLCALTLGILSIWVMPYVQQTNVGYFQKIKQIKNLGYGADSQPGTGRRPDDPFGPL